MTSPSQTSSPCFLPLMGTAWRAEAVVAGRLRASLSEGHGREAVASFRESGHPRPASRVHLAYLPIGRRQHREADSAFQWGRR